MPRAFDHGDDVVPAMLPSGSGALPVMTTSEFAQAFDHGVDVVPAMPPTGSGALPVMPPSEVAQDV
ncbi:MAG: hypothetical protein JW943_04700 [Deltaproteobacteria bacterium]|nr:hypothetical protein [Deltaproteobacteria bacterium]